MLQPPLRHPACDPVCVHVFNILVHKSLPMGLSVALGLSPRDEMTEPNGRLAFKAFIFRKIFASPSPTSSRRVLVSLHPTITATLDKKGYKNHCY